jgi:threonyl-tRNA synthetase
MAEAVKDAVNQAVEGVKNLAVSAEEKAPAAAKAPKPKKEKRPKVVGMEIVVPSWSTRCQHISTIAYRSCRWRVSRVPLHRLTLLSEKLKAKHDEEIATKPRGILYSAETKKL